MPKSRTIRLAAFNIVTHPHSAKSYEEIFTTARGLKQIIKIWGDTHAFLCSAYRLEKSKSPTITGEVFTFSEIDITQPWFDIQKGEQASDEQTEEVNIPENIRPHLKKVRYVFFPHEHIFVYTREDSAQGGISPLRMGEFLTALLNDNRILAKAAFQAVDVRLVQDHRSIAEIFENLRVERLEITIRRPNGDTGGEAEESVEKELEDQNIEEYFVSQKAEKGKGLKPNRRTSRLLREATLNGHVQAKGMDKEDISRTLNTSDSPLVEPVIFDGKQPYVEFIVNSAISLVKRLIHGRKIDADKEKPKIRGHSATE